MYRYIYIGTKYLFGVVICTVDSFVIGHRGLFHASKFRISRPRIHPRRECCGSKESSANIYTRAKFSGTYKILEYRRKLLGNASSICIRQVHGARNKRQPFVLIKIAFPSPRLYCPIIKFKIYNTPLLARVLGLTFH